MSDYTPPFTDGVDVPAPDAVPPVEPVTEGDAGLPLAGLPASEPVYFPPVEADTEPGPEQPASEPAAQPAEGSDE